MFPIMYFWMPSVLYVSSIMRDLIMIFSARSFLYYIFCSHDCILSAVLFFVLIFLFSFYTGLYNLIPNDILNIF